MPRAPDRKENGGPAAELSPQRSATLTSQIGVTVTRLDDARQRKARVEGWLAPGPEVCGPTCPWCYAPNWTGGIPVRRWGRRSS
jgi:hypothetical protein